jgi:hypothetical protein
MQTKNFGLASVIKRMVGTHRMGPKRRYNAGLMLPKEMLDGSWSALEAAGVLRLGERDDLFVSVLLPLGWQIRPTGERSMWSDLLDGNGRRRATIFYKRGLYDRRAHMRANTRYTLCSVWVPADKVCHYQVRDGDKVLYSTEHMSRPDLGAEQAPLLDPVGESRRRHKNALDWIEDNFPLWHDVQAYWDDQDKAA